MFYEKWAAECRGEAEGILGHRDSHCSSNTHAEDRAVTAAEKRTSGAGEKQGQRRVKWAEGG